MMHIGLILAGGEQFGSDVDPEMQGEEVIEQLLEEKVIQPASPGMAWNLFLKDIPLPCPADRSSGWQLLLRFVREKM